MLHYKHLKSSLIFYSYKNIIKNSLNRINQICLSCAQHCGIGQFIHIFKKGIRCSIMFICFVYTDPPLLSVKQENKVYVFTNFLFRSLNIYIRYSNSKALSYQFIINTIINVEVYMWYIIDGHIFYRSQIIVVLCNRDNSIEFKYD